MVQQGMEIVVVIGLCGVAHSVINAAAAKAKAAVIGWAAA